MERDYSKLLGKMKERGETQESVSSAIGKTLATLNSRLNNRSEFDQGEIESICSYLGIEDSEIPAYFFAH